MKVEISHDTLAKKVYEKSSAQDKMRLKVINFIRTSHIYYQDSSVLLKQDDLNYINPYLKDITLKEEELHFIKKSKDAAKRKFIFAVLGVIVVIATLLIFWRQAVNGKNEADNLKTDVIAKNASLTRTVKQLEEEKRLGQKYLDALDDKTNIINIQNDTIKGLMLNLAQQRDSLQELTILLAAKNETLQEEKETISQEKEVIAKEKEKIAKDKDLIEKLMKTAEEERAIARSAALSSFARIAYESGDEKYAFRLAATSWELNHDNKQACNVLYDLHNPNISYPEQHSANKYPKMPVIIKKQKAKYKTTELSDREIKNIFTKNNRKISSSVQSMQIEQKQLQNKLKNQIKNLQNRRGN
ncbi:MAG: hypothetical protein GY810_00560 [Aureispira sp.]|nr:hypothetical protein [Aureispira sp.]